MFRTLVETKIKEQKKVWDWNSQLSTPFSSSSCSSPVLPPPAGPAEEVGGSGFRGVWSGPEPADLSTAAGQRAAAGPAGPEEGRRPQQAVGGAREKHQEQRTGTTRRPVRNSQEGGVGGGEGNSLSPVPQSLQSAKEVHQLHHDVDELKGWMAEKEAVLDSEEDQDLHSIQTLLRQHEALEVGNTHQDTGTGRTLGGGKIWNYEGATAHLMPLSQIKHAKVLSGVSLKGQFAPKIKLHFLLFPVVLFKHLDSFVWVAQFSRYRL